MDKPQLIGRLFKILPLKEQCDLDEVTVYQLKSYINKQYVYFNGIKIDYDLKMDIVANLKGLKSVCADLSKDELKQIVLRMTNTVERYGE